CFGIANNVLPGGIPSQLSPNSGGNVCEVAGRYDLMTALQIGNRLLARLDAVEEVTRVIEQLILAITRGVFNGFSAGVVWHIFFGLRAADWVPTHNSGNDVHRLLLFVRNNFKPVAGDRESAFRAVKEKARRVDVRCGGGAFTYLTRHLKTGIVDDS